MNKTHSPYVDGYQAALLDVLVRIEDETTIDNALGAGLAWIIHNGGEEVRTRATAVVQRLLA